MRALLLVLAAFTGTVGWWAGFSPESFFANGPVPFLHTGWVAMLPPYNEHLVRDYGFMNLGMTLVLVVAAIRPTPVLVRTSTGALMLFAVPHTVFHLFHLEHMSTAAAITQTLTTVVLTVLLPAIVFLLSFTQQPSTRTTSRS